MSKSFKPAYRKHKTAMSTSAKVIIALLVVLVVTLLAFLIKLIVEKAKNSNEIVYPTDELESYSAAVYTNAPEETGGDESGIKTRGIDSAEFNNKTGSLVLVNREHAYELPQSQKLVNLYSEKHDNFQLNSASEQLTEEAYAALCRMCDEYKDNNGFCPLMIVSSYRDEAAQRLVYDKEENKDKVEAPGYSDHHTGLGFDVSLKDKNENMYSYGRNATVVAPWIVENHRYYGFIMRYPLNKSDVTGIDGETNHFRYVGLPHSVYIEENSLCLEEYLTRIRSFTYDAPLQMTVDGVEYSVWYCGGKSVRVPKEGEYEVSGDNMGGFIVTARREAKDDTE